MSWTVLIIASRPLWLRSKCSICSYQFNIWYIPHWGTIMMTDFLNWRWLEACFHFVFMGWPGIALSPGMAHSLRGEILKHVKSSKFRGCICTQCNISFNTDIRFYTDMIFVRHVFACLLRNKLLIFTSSYQVVATTAKTIK